MITEDLCTEIDLLACDAGAASDFGESPLIEKIRLAVRDWLEPRLLQHGLGPERHRTRRQPTACWTYTGGAWTDATKDAGGDGDGILPATVFATPGTDAIYVGLDRPFRGVFAGLVDSVNTLGIAASLTYWNGEWSTLGSSLVNGTAVNGSASVPFARGGRITWPEPDDWLRRSVHESDALFWVRLQVNSTPSACHLEQLLPITRSRLTYPVALHALSLLYREGVGGSRGDWAAKATAFSNAAGQAFDLVIGLAGDEFDVDDDGAVAATEVNSVASTVERWTFERG